MPRLLWITLLICTLAACSPVPFSSPQPTPPVTAVDPEEYALFSAMIEQDLIGYNQGQLILIREQSDPDIRNLEVALKGPNDLPPDLVQAYRLRNEQPYKLDHAFNLKQDYKLLPESEYDGLLRTERLSWADFEAKYPEADGIFIFSRAGLNGARDQALVSASYYCGSLCAEGGLFLMVKEDGIWKIEQELIVWMA